MYGEGDPRPEHPQGAGEGLCKDREMPADGLDAFRGHCFFASVWKLYVNLRSVISTRKWIGNSDKPAEHNLFCGLFLVFIPLKTASKSPYK